MTYAFTPPTIPSLPIQGSDQRYPVHRIFCIGRNYAEHAREMGATPEAGTPMFFCKPADAIVSDGADTPYPPLTSELHHEVEMVVALGGGGRDIAAARVPELIFGYGVGLDLTRRDLQRQVKAKGHPWEIAKGFDHSAPLSALQPASAAHVDDQTVLRLSVNGQVRQQTTLADMIHDVPAIVSALSTLFELHAGDLVFTGTPAGVAALERGDQLHAELVGVAELRTRIV
ncbi:MAG TPA: fumarylacetoacetate hydrolase family protein [Rhodanobacter sp.]|jgi:fumarylpyruvate hydrolase|nr:fumarylacetoacetate hydrolase family protein [Rhodanobacter sp.]